MIFLGTIKLFDMHIFTDHGIQMYFQYIPIFLAFLLGIFLPWISIELYAVFFKVDDQVAVKTGNRLLTVGMVFIIQGMAFDGLKHVKDNHLDRL